MPSLFSSSSSNTTNQNGTSTVGTSGASSSTPTFSSGLQSLMDSLQGYSTQSMTNPSAQLAPIQSAGLDQINQQYATAPDTGSAQLPSRGLRNTASRPSRPDSDRRRRPEQSAVRHRSGHGFGPAREPRLRQLRTDGKFAGEGGQRESRRPVEF